MNGKVFKTQWDGTLRRLTKTSPEGRKTFTFFDAKGKVIKDSTAGIAAVMYKYDSKGRRSEANQGGRKTTFEYDSLGRRAKVKDPSGRETRFFYDATDRLVRTILPSNNESLFGYDSNGNLTTVTPPSKPEHIFEYSPDDLETLYTPPFTGDSARSTARVYNLDEEMTRVARPDSLNMDIFYGGTGSLAGQPKRVSYDRGMMAFLYDTTKGLMVGIVPPCGDSLLYGYDGQMLKETRWTGRIRGDVAFTYNSDMQVITEKVNTTDSINFVYDKDGLLKTAGVMKHHYGTNNNLLLADTVGNVITEYGYNAFGEQTSQRSRISSTVIYQVGFVRDSLGRITQKIESTQNGINRFNYAYDANGRLKRIARNDTTSSIYTYDANGNRLSHTTPTKVDSGMYDTQDRMLGYGNAQYVYSSNGDLRAKITPNSGGGADTTKYTYDAFGNLVNVQFADGATIEYMVDGQNRRVGKKENGVLTKRWLCSNDLRIVAELDSGNEIMSRFVYTTSDGVHGSRWRSLSAHQRSSWERASCSGCADWHCCAATGL